MAYSGFLIKVGDYTIPFKFMKAESYQVTRNVQDLDSYRDANGKLHRTALEHIVHKVEFETPAMLTNTEVSEFMSNIRRNYTVPVERKALVTLYVPEFDTYETQEMYMPDIPFQIYGTYNNKLTFKPFRVAFIGY
ncbi:MAG: DUF6711 family protein [Cellulosilyticum sp.]|nr:DUF6711 family protein [Cellulosilyticum sp.]